MAAPLSRMNLIAFILFSLVTAQIAIAQNAQFSADKTSGCFPVTVNFTDASTGGVTSWLWNFGNGNTSLLQNPSAVYTQAGVYTVTLTVSNGVQSDVEVKTGFIVVNDYPSVDFSLDKTSGCSPLQVQFTNNVSTSSGAISNWQWIFGDGGTSNVANPSYTYNQPGTPSVSLKATNIHGCETTATKPSVLNVIGPAVAFNASATTLCQVPSLITFTNQSTGTGPLTHLWNFGDGSTSTEVSPAHTFTSAGTSTVKLTTTDALGCSAFYTQDILAGNEGGLDFLPSTLQLCKGQSLSFTVQNSAPIVSANWDFGNNTSSTSLSPIVVYQQSGTYKITLAAQLQGKSCQSVVTKTVVVSAEANTAFTAVLSCTNAMTLTNTSTGAQRVEWSIGGAVISTANALLYNPPTGDFEITLTAFNAFGCGKALKKTIAVPSLPSAAFEPSRQQDCVEQSLSGCAPFQVNFKNTSVGEPSFTSSWSLGEGVTSSAADPVRIFANPGIFTVRLVITDSRGCKDTVQNTVRVSNTMPVANFSIDKLEVCAGENINFKNLSTNADFLCWDFGDGAVITGNDPTHAYAIPGRYLVRLTAKNAGCSDIFTAQDSITVKDPLAAFEIVKSCSDPYLVQFFDRSGNADSIHWDLGDGTTSTSASFSHRYAALGQYPMTFTAVNRTTQCVVPLPQTIVIQDLTADFVLANETPCRNNPTDATDLSAFATSWYWIIDNNVVSQAKHPTLTFTTPGLHTLRLIVGDNEGCSEQKQISVNVPNINGDFSFQATSNCQELTVNFSDASIAIPPIQTRQWDFGDGQTSNLTDPTNVYLSKDTFDIVLRLTNAEGQCSFTKKDAIVFSIPIIEFSTSKTNYCLKETVQFVNQTINAKTFDWNFGNGNSSTGFGPSTFYNSAGSYDVTLDATDKYGCTMSVTRPHFIVVAPPKADFNAFQTSGECPPLTSIFQSTSSGSSLLFDWNFGNGLTSKVKDPACTYTKPGTYDVLLKVTDAFGCTDSKLVEDLIYVGGPSGSFDMDVTTACSNALTSFLATAENTKVYQWDFGDGNVVNHNEASLKHEYNNPGKFKPALVLIDEKNCAVVADGSREIIIHDSTAVDFVASPDCVFNGETILVKASNNDNEILQWFVNGQLVAGGLENSIVADSAGVYEIRLEGTNQFGCVSSFATEVKVHGTIDFIPNVFTVNGDAYNEFFVIPGVEKSDWTLQIFNRWGKEVWQGRNYVNTWQAGTVASGMYYYYLTNQVCPQKDYKGYVNILK